MFIFDVETLGKRSNSVILSMAAIYFDPDTKPSPQELREGAFFAKFSVKEQVKEYGREMNQPTMDWWNKQCTNVRVASFLPSKVDCSFVDGYESMRKWAASKNNTKCWVWARGNLDQLVMDDIEEQLELEPILESSQKGRAYLCSRCGSSGGKLLMASRRVGSSSSIRSDWI